MSSTSINPTSTSLPGITGATTPSTFTDTTSAGGPQYSVGAILTETDTTVTAFQVLGTTGLLVVDGTTLTWRHEGITLSDGDVISAGFNGLLDQTTTALLGPIQVTGSSSSGIYTIETINPTTSPTLLHGTRTTKPTVGVPSTSSSSNRGGVASASTSSTSSTAGTAPTLSAGRAAALLGALGGLVVLAL